MNSDPADGDAGSVSGTGEQPACPSPEQVGAGEVVPEGCPSEGQPCPLATDVAQGAAVPAGCPETGLNCPTETEVAGGAPVPPGCPAAGLPDDPAAGDSAAAGLDQQYEMGRGCSDDPTASNCALTEVTRSAGVAPGASRAQKLSRVRKILAGTRVRIGPGGKREPMGISVSLEVTVTGMNGERLKVYWSMESAKTNLALDQRWLRNTEAATLRARADTDQLTSELWLPLPREPGRYRARVTLVDEQDRHFLKRSAVFQ